MMLIPGNPGKGRRRKKRFGRKRRPSAAPALSQSGSPSPSPSVRQALTSTGSTRVQQRQARLRRRRLGGAGAVVAAGLVVVVILAFVVNRAVRDDGDDAPPARTQQTLLVQIRGADNLARSSVLLAHDPADGRASMTFIPPGVLAQAPGLGTVPFEEALQLRGPGASRGALADLLGVTVDHDWTLTEAGFSGLVDRLGGVAADVDVDVVVPAAGGRKVVLVTPGPKQVLDGARALAYATYLAPGEDQLGAFPRLQEVLEGILAKVETTAALTPILQATSRAAPSTLAPPKLAELLVGVAGSADADRVSVATLPVVPIDSGAPRLRYRLDEVPALELVKRVLLQSVPAGRFDGNKRVIIQNGVGAPGLTTTAQQRLSAAGFDIIRTGNANRFDFATSVILVTDATAASTQLGAQVARTLGLPATVVRVNPQRNSVTDVVVILGRDFKR